MIKAKVYNKHGSLSGEINLSESVFGIKPNLSVLWQYVKYYLANQRSGTHSAKTRSEVSGGGRKPWRQKGTGRARAGSTRSPLWRHGGVIFPPKPREYRMKMPRKMRRLALMSILSDRASENMIFVFDGFDMPEIKTKRILEILANAEINANRPTLIITESNEKNIVKSANNIKNLHITHTNELNPYQIMVAENIIIEKKALSKIEELCRR